MIGTNGEPLAMRWNGKRWSVQRSASIPRGAALNDVSCPTATDCTAVGVQPPAGQQLDSFGEPLAERWTSTR
jgi:hypothetical protein